MLPPALPSCKVMMHTGISEAKGYPVVKMSNRITSSTSYIFMPYSVSGSNTSEQCLLDQVGVVVGRVCVLVWGLLVALPAVHHSR